MRDTCFPVAVYGSQLGAKIWILRWFWMLVYRQVPWNLSAGYCHICLFGICHHSPQHSHQWQQEYRAGLAVAMCVIILRNRSMILPLFVSIIMPSLATHSLFEVFNPFQSIKNVSENHSSIVLHSVLSARVDSWLTSTYFKFWFVFVICLFVF